jgi:HD domain
MAYIGTLPWARQTGGRIGVCDRAELIRLAALTGFADLPRYLLYRGRKRSWSPAGSYDNVPGTVATTAALTRLSAVAPAYLINHSIRTYWFSRLIGDATGLTFDDELLYVASLAHDVGLCPDCRPLSPRERCFSICGANWATDIAVNAGWKTERSDRLAQAITLNLNGRVPPTLGVEAHLMMRGVLVDVTGLYAWSVDRSQLQGLFRQFPRLDQRTRLPLMFRAEADRQPECRAHFALRWLGFGLLMRHPPREWT